MDMNKSALTFINNRNIPINEIQSMFSEIGEVKSVNQCGTRMFVHYRTEEEAKRANSHFKDHFNLTFARVRNENGSKSSDGQDMKKGKKHSYSHPTANKENNESLNKPTISNEVFTKSSTKRGTGRDSGQMKTVENTKSTSQCLKDSGNTPLLKMSSGSNNNTLRHRRSESTKAESIRSFKIDDGSDHSTKDCPPPLIDWKQIPKLRGIVLGNIPDQYTLSDVYSLVEEVKPAAFTQIDYTDGRKLKFCEIYVRSEEDISYLSQKLNGFMICGKKLIAVEPSKLLAQPKWDL